MFFRAKCRKCKRACEWKVLASTLLKTSSCLFCLNFGRGARWQCLKVVITFRSTQKCVFEVLWMVTVYSPELVLDVFCWLSGVNKKIRVVTFYLWLKWAIMQQVNFLSAHCTQLSPPHAITLTHHSQRTWPVTVANIAQTHKANPFCQPTASHVFDLPLLFDDQTWNSWMLTRHSYLYLDSFFGTLVSVYGIHVFICPRYTKGSGPGFFCLSDRVQVYFHQQMSQ